MEQKRSLSRVGEGPRQLEAQHYHVRRESLYIRRGAKRAVEARDADVWREGSRECKVTASAQCTLHIV